MTTQKTLYDLQIGDKVIVSSNRTREIRKVVRVTNTRIVVGFANYVDHPYEKQFEKKTGREWGNSDSYYYCGIRPYTEQEGQEMILDSKKKKLESLVLSLPKDNPTLINEVYDFLTEKGLLK